MAARVGLHHSMVREPKRLPPEPATPLIHERTYTVRSYREAANVLRIRGMVNDVKPPGIYFPDDPEPLDVHQMVVDLFLDFPSLEITRADVVMEVTPHRSCVSIEPDYQQLVGLSIARGFSRKIKDLFGGPKGCTHIGALLQAMAPVAIQSMWSMQAIDDDGTPVGIGNRVSSFESADDPEAAEEARKRAFGFNVNTCHIWDAEGEQVAQLRAGQELDPPLWAVERLQELGRDPSEWRQRSGE